MKMIYLDTSTVSKINTDFTLLSLTNIYALVLSRHLHCFLSYFLYNYEFINILTSPKAELSSLYQCALSK